MDCLDGVLQQQHRLRYGHGQEWCQSNRFGNSPQSHALHCSPGEISVQETARCRLVSQATTEPRRGLGGAQETCHLIQRPILELDYLGSCLAHLLRGERSAGGQLGRENGQSNSVLAGRRRGTHRRRERISSFPRAKFEGRGGCITKIPVG